MKSPPKFALNYIVKRLIVKCHIIITHLQPKKESPEMPSTLCFLGIREAAERNSAPQLPSSITYFLFIKCIHDSLNYN